MRDRGRFVDHRQASVDAPSQDRALLFMHVRKTAGLSFRHRLASRFDAAACLRPSVLDGLRVSVNGHPLAIQKRAVESTVIIEASVPPGALQDDQARARILFSVDETLRPCDLDPAVDDRRHLGIALSGIRLRPVRAAETASMPR